MKHNKLWILVIGLLLASCAGEDPADNPDVLEVKMDVQITAPSNRAQYTIGEDFEIQIEVNHPDLISDLELWVDDTLFKGDLELTNQSITIPTTNSRVGYIPVYLKYKDGAGADHRDNRTIVLFSDITPCQMETNVSAILPHEKSSYTQGLEFYKGRLYEGTGQYEESKLLEIDLKTGAAVRTLNLDASIFGEGITILNDTVYQISYKAGKCLVYDVNTFEKITEFSYTGDGWGLCNDGSNIIMSNGSDQLVWRDPRTFQVTKKLDVFDNQSSLGQINELEIIDGDLYANIYTDSRLAKIDTATGKILCYINCKPLISEQPAGVDVLNGIAYNSKTGKIYLTGKWWPNLYEVTFQ